MVVNNNEKEICAYQKIMDKWLENTKIDSLDEGELELLQDFVTMMDYSYEPPVELTDENKNEILGGLI